MFESLDNRPLGVDSEVEETPRPKARASTGFQLWPLIAGLLIFSGVATVHNWYLAGEDAKIVAREQFVEGHIYGRTTGKGQSVSYSFSYKGNDYRAIESDHPRMSVGDAVTVYLDSDDPRINSLVEYRLRSQQRHSWMVVFGCISAGSVLTLAVLWGVNEFIDKLSQEEPAT
jgi:hypothetical protein